MWLLVTGFPHIYNTQGKSGNFEILKNLRETQDILTFFKTQYESEQF